MVPSKVYTEEIVYTESEDGLILEGAIIRPVIGAAERVAVVWIHGFPGNFYRPMCIRVGRAVAGEGYTVVTGNNRGHDMGAYMLRAEGQPVVAGSWWESFDESPRDVAAWVKYAMGLGVQSVALLGYSIGATKAIYYQAQRQDRRVLGLIAVSGPVRRARGVTSEFTAIATRMVAEGRGQDLMPAEPWNRPFPPPRPGPVSARTYLSWAQSNLDVFGLDTGEPAIAAIRCPLFVCYGTNEMDIGAPDDLEMIQRNARAATKVETRVFEGADHFYAGHEEKLATAIAGWVKTLV